MVLPLGSQSLLKSERVIKVADVLKFIEADDDLDFLFFTGPFWQIKDFLRGFAEFLPVKTDGEVVERVDTEAESRCEAFEEPFRTLDAFFPFRERHTKHFFRQLCVEFFFAPNIEKVKEAES